MPHLTSNVATPHLPSVGDVASANFSRMGWQALGTRYQRGHVRKLGHSYRGLSGRGGWQIPLACHQDHWTAHGDPTLGYWDPASIKTSPITSSSSLPSSFHLPSPSLLLPPSSTPYPSSPLIPLCFASHCTVFQLPCLIYLQFLKTPSQWLPLSRVLCPLALRARARTRTTMASRAVTTANLSPTW